MARVVEFRRRAGGGVLHERLVDAVEGSFALRRREVHFAPLLMHVDGDAAVPLEEVVRCGDHGCVRSGLNMLLEGGSLYSVRQKPCW